MTPWLHLRRHGVTVYGAGFQPVIVGAHSILLLSGSAGSTLSAARAARPSLPAAISAALPSGPARTAASAHLLHLLELVGCQNLCQLCVYFRLEVGDLFLLIVGQVEFIL
jgi:hypothetical protein